MLVRPVVPLCAKFTQTEHGPRGCRLRLEAGRLLESLAALRVVVLLVINAAQRPPAFFPRWIEVQRLPVQIDCGGIIRFVRCVSLRRQRCEIGSSAEQQNPEDRDHGCSAWARTPGCFACASAFNRFTISRSRSP